MSRKKKRKSTTGGEGLTHSPFDNMPTLGKLPAGPNSESQTVSSENSQSEPAKTSKRGQKNTNRGRVDIIRQTAHRGGKAVTVVVETWPDDSEPDNSRRTQTNMSAKKHRKLQSD